MNENKKEYEHMCGKCHKPFVSLRAGFDEHYVIVAKRMVDFCYREGMTDREGQIAMKNWLGRLMKRANKKEKLFQLIKEFLDE